MCRVHSVSFYSDQYSKKVMSELFPILNQRIFVRWLKVNFNEVFVSWIHIKALRVFVESVLR